MELKQLKHDFINNSLRIEILFKLINEDLQSDKKINPARLEDLKKFSKLTLEHIEELEKI